MVIRELVRFLHPVKITCIFWISNIDMISLVMFDRLLSCFYFVHLYRLTLILMVKELPVMCHLNTCLILFDIFFFLPNDTNLQKSLPDRNCLHTLYSLVIDSHNNETLNNWKGTRCLLIMTSNFLNQTNWPS